MRITIPLLRVVELLCLQVSIPHYGYEIAARTGLSPATVQPILHRLEKAGWLESYWEDINPSEQHRPRRRLFIFTEEGFHEALKLLEEHQGRV